MGVGLWPENTNTSLVPDEIFDPKSGTQPHTDYQNDPIGWAVSKLGIAEYTLRWSINPGYDTHNWDGSFDPLALLYESVANWQSVGVESGTGTGKSFGTAVLILWWLACWENSRVFTFAPKEEQLRLYIWMELGKLWPKFHAHFPEAKLSDLRIRMKGGTDDSWGAVGYAVGISVGEDIATKAAGMHAEHLLLVYEEMPGIPLPVLEAGENTCTAPHNLRVGIGNPNHRQDTLHRHCTSPGVVSIRMSALDHPNVVADDPSIIPGAISRISIDRRRIKYGLTSPVYESRVRGISPEQASDSLIRYEWLEASAARYKARASIPTIVTGKGVDVANSEHGDRACIVDFADNVCVRISAFQCPDSNALGRQVSMEMDGGSSQSLQAWRVGVDAIGVGAGTVNELRRLGKSVQALNVSMPPKMQAEKAPDGGTYEWAPDSNQFKNLRSQMYWQAREDFRLGAIDVPEDPELWEELTAPTFVDEPKTIVEPKDEVKKRLGRSPDKADAFVIANWVRKRVIVRQEKKSIPDDISPGYDYKKGRVATKPTADEEVARMIDRALPQSPTVGRYGIPRRR